MNESYMIYAKWAIFQLYYGKNKLFLMGWWWCPLCTRPTQLVCFSSASLLKQLSSSRHATPLVHTILTLWFYSANLLKQQSSSRHATPLVHTILTLCFYSASLLKQQSSSRHATPLVHTILTQPVFTLTPWCCML